MESTKIVRIKTDLFNSLTEKAKGISSKLTISKYVEQMNLFFDKTGISPYRIADIPTVEIKNNTDKILKAQDRMIKIIKAFERDLNVKIGKISLEKTEGDFLFPTEKVTSEMFLEMENIELSKSQWMEILGLAQERCLIIERQDKQIERLEKELSGYQNNKNEYTGNGNDFTGAFKEFTEKIKQQPSKRYPGVYEINADILDEKKKFFFNLVEYEPDETRNSLKEWFSNIIYMQEKPFYNKEDFTKYTNQLLRTLD